VRVHLDEADPILWCERAYRPRCRPVFRHGCSGPADNPGSWRDPGGIGPGASVPGRGLSVTQSSSGTRL
jgi:hypothetical protein